MWLRCFIQEIIELGKFLCVTRFWVAWKSPKAGLSNSRISCLNKNMYMILTKEKIVCVNHLFFINCHILFICCMHVHVLKQLGLVYFTFWVPKTKLSSSGLMPSSLTLWSILYSIPSWHTFFRKIWTGVECKFQDSKWE